MKRIYAEPPDELMGEIAKATEKMGINRHQLVLKAIDSFLHGNGSNSDSLRKEFDSLKIELDSLRSNRDSLMVELERKRAEIDSLKKENDSIQNKFDSQTIKMNQTTIKIDSLNDELKQSVIAFDSLRKDLSHANDIIKLKDEDISFLKGHISQLSEKLPKALPPSEEEAKAKHWYEFWK